MGNSALEFAVLAHLEGAALIQAELARRAGVSEAAVQLVLDPMVARGFVVRQPQGAEPATFRLTMTGVKRLKGHREYSEARAGQEWRREPSEEPEGSQEPRLTWTWAGETPPPQQGNPALEQALIEQLEHTAMAEAELVRRTGAPANDVQAALDKLVAETFVWRQQHDDRPTEYELTEGGVGRLKLVREFAESPMSAMGKVLGAAATQAVRGRRRPVAVVRASRRRLSDSEREACSTALAEQFGAGRIDISELHRRTDLLYAATTRNDLGAVFEGLPSPSLDQEPAGKPAPGWRSGAAGCTSLVSVFFGLMGLALINGHDDVDDVVFGLLLVGGAVVWNYLVWSWARRRVN
ncbi:DUF1707 domain-containing protein [Kribbella antibiotica]|uniref:DUF1707 domain-containing protein n=1 Tax=Kribbella antibiotica TaxID=190195 RepID=A0A4R4ZIF0_9ACTN|nr:DUF1707 domain-containing protein [Kribbella antibiotica]